MVRIFIFSSLLSEPLRFAAVRPRRAIRRSAARASKPACIHLGRYRESITQRLLGAAHHRRIERCGPTAPLIGALHRAGGNRDAAPCKERNLLRGARAVVRRRPVERRPPPVVARALGRRLVDARGAGDARAGRGLAARVLPEVADLAVLGRRREQPDEPPHVELHALDLGEQQLLAPRRVAQRAHLLLAAPPVQRRRRRPKRAEHEGQMAGPGGTVKRRGRDQAGKDPSP